MQYLVDDIKLDENNTEFNNAVEFVRHTDKLVYITGKAGTGKTTFLKYIKSTTEKNAVVLAPTGVAAINSGGVTINSFFQIPFGPFLPNDPRLQISNSDPNNNESIFSTFRYNKEKREIIENLELLIIDEISMVRCDMLDVIDKILRVFRRKAKLPFGGVQVILIGDTFQLPPIADNDQWRILSRFYKTPYFFNSKVIEQNAPIYIELKKIYRQNEKEFIDLLNKVRENKLTQSDLNTLNSKYDPAFSGDNSDYIILATHNKKVRETNLTKLNQLKTELFTFSSNVTGEFPNNAKPTDDNLQLKVGAQVMFIKNDSGEYKEYFNGKIGKINELYDDKIKVIFEEEDRIVNVERSVWKNIKYTYNREKKQVEEEVIGTFEQFPLKLAWAITVHKSQGLTFPKVIADLNQAFAPGQVYVALSRCTSLSGLVLKSKLTPSSIKTDPSVLEFAESETPSTLINEELVAGKADFYYRKAREEFNKENLEECFDYFKKALKYRNDIDTEDFKKFFIVKAKKLLSYKKKFTQINKECDVKTDQLNAEIERSEGLQKKLDYYLNNIEYLNSRIRSLEDELQEEKQENQFHKSEVDRIKNIKWYEKLIGKK